MRVKAKTIQEGGSIGGHIECLNMTEEITQQYQNIQITLESLVVKELIWDHFKAGLIMKLKQQWIDENKNWKMTFIKNLNINTS